MTEPKPRGPRVAEVIDGVVWDYDPEHDHPSPLVSTRRYFRDFPWEPEAPSPAPAAAENHPHRETNAS